MLIKSVLTSLSIYLMSLYKVAACIIDRPNRCMHNFLWKGNTETRGLRKMGWNSIVLPKDLGGLYVRDFILVNCSLLMKWLWKLRVVDHKSIWYEVCVRQYGFES